MECEKDCRTPVALRTLTNEVTAILTPGHTPLKESISLMERPPSAVPAHAAIEAAEVSYLATVDHVVIHQHAQEIGHRA